MGKRSRPRHRFRHTPHKTTLIGKRAKVLEHGEGIICAGPLATTVEVPRSKARRFATVHRRSKDFGIGHGRQPTQLTFPQPCFAFGFGLLHPSLLVALLTSISTGEPTSV